MVTLSSMQRKLFFILPIFIVAEIYSNLKHLSSNYYEKLSVIFNPQISNTNGVTTRVNFSQFISSFNNSAKAFDDYCDRFGEWERIGNDFYIKREAVYYLLDAELFYFALIKRRDHPFQLKINVSLFEKQENNKNELLDQFELKNLQDLETTWNYEYNKTFFIVNTTSMRKHFSDLSVEEINNRFKIDFYLIDVASNRSTQKPVKVKIKNLNNTNVEKKKSSLVCPKCFFLTKSRDLLATRWWFELLKQGGYDNLFYCDQSVEKGVGFEEIVNEYKDFLIIEPLICMPNLQKNKKYFHRNYVQKTNELERYDTPVFNNLIFNMISHVTINQCYMDNIDKYRYIAVFDNDEIVIPVKTENIFNIEERINFTQLLANNTKPLQQSVSCNRYEKKAEPFHEFVQDFRTYSEYKDPQQMNYFGQGLFFENRQADEIFSKLEKLIDDNQSALEEKNATYNYKLNFYDAKRTQNPGNFSLAIYNHNDYTYAKTLLSLYKTRFKPFLDKYKDLFEKYMKYFDRVFYSAGKPNGFKFGKTMHDTKTSFTMTLHMMEFFYERKYDNDVIKVINDMYGHTKTSFGSRNAWHVSHFRNESYFRYEGMPFTNFYIDFNYLFCYIIPIFEKFEKIKIEL
jgi:hypothetical protein